MRPISIDTSVFPTPCISKSSLPCFIFFTLFLLSKPQLSISYSLAFPLKTSIIPFASLPRPPIKVLFRHNVTLSISMAVGTPPQNVTVVVDTGSELSWLRCNKTGQFNRGFDPARSTSYSGFSCDSPTCTNRTQDFSVPASCDPNRLCHATLSYADGSSSEGTVSSDTFGFGGSQAPGTVFGCMTSESSSNPEEDSKSAGLLGMNRGSLSFVSQMSVPKFSYCISGFDISGVLYLGDADIPWIPKLSYTPLVTVSTRLPSFDRFAYTVRLEGIKVSGETLPIPKSAIVPDHTGAGQTMLDSGTQFSYLLGPVYKVLRSEFLNRTSGILRALEDPSFIFQGTMDLCYLIPLDQKILPPLPAVSLVFEGAEMVVEGGERLLYPTGEIRGKDSVHCFTFGNSDLLPIEAFLIGHHHQRGMWMEFDVGKSRMGLAPAQCNQAAQKLGVVGPY